MNANAQFSLFDHYFITQTISFFSSIAQSVLPGKNQNISSLLEQGASGMTFNFVQPGATGASRHPSLIITPTAQLNQRRVIYKLMLKIPGAGKYVTSFAIKIPSSPASIERTFREQIQVLWDTHLNGSSFVHSTPLTEDVLSILIHYSSVIYYLKQYHELNKPIFAELIKLHLPIIKAKLSTLSPIFRNGMTLLF